MIHVVRYLLVVLYTIFWAVPACILGTMGFGEAVGWIARRWVRWILWTCGVDVEATGLENVDWNAPAMFMSNHQSAFDIPAIVDTLPGSFRFVAKRELTRVPFFGWALVAGGHIIVDRFDRPKAIASLDRAVERMRAGIHVIFFPEGTRQTTGRLGEFKSGGFYLAIAAGVPVVPVSVSGSQHITPKRSLAIDSGRIRVHYGTPIPTADMGIEDRVRLKQLVREGILEGFDPELQGSGHSG